VVFGAFALITRRPRRFCAPCGPRDDASTTFSGGHVRRACHGAGVRTAGSALVV